MDTIATAAFTPELVYAIVLDFDTVMDRYFYAIHLNGVYQNIAFGTLSDALTHVAFFAQEVEA